MKIVNAHYTIISPSTTYAKSIPYLLESIARTCYKSETLATDTSSDAFLRHLIERGHTSMLEHEKISVRFVVDRGVSHEMVRHRLASFAQESTRYCNYSQERFGNEITVIKPSFFQEGSTEYQEWETLCLCAENTYFKLLKLGATPQEARAVLPNSLKTELVVTANLREWRHILNLRAAGTTGKPHPQMLEVMVPLLAELKSLLPVVFDDIKIKEDA